MTIAGGKLSSYRKMAEDLTDLLCRKLGKSAVCTTHKETLWGELVTKIPRDIFEHAYTEQGESLLQLQVA